MCVRTCLLVHVTFVCICCVCVHICILNGWREAEQSGALQCSSTAFLCSVVISPETSEQVKASERGREGGRRG